MADPRHDRLELPGAAPAAALSVVRRRLVAVAQPPIERSAHGRISPASIPAIAAAAPMARLESTLTFPPTRREEVARRLQSPTVSGWLVTQERSRFGACLRLQGAPSAATQVELDFGGEPGRGREERPRLERFLAAAVEAGVLPPGASVARLLDRFFAEALPGPGRCLPRSLPAMVEGGGDDSGAGLAGPRSERPGTDRAPARALGLPTRPHPLPAEGGGPCQLVIFSGMDSGLAARVAEIGEAAFSFWCDDGRDLDEHVVDALVSAVGEDPLRSTGTAPGRVGEAPATGWCCSSTLSRLRTPTPSRRRARWPCT